MSKLIVSLVFIAVVLGGGLMLKNKESEELKAAHYDREACEYAREVQSAEIWKYYVDDFPGGICLFEAKSEINRIKAQEEAKRKDEEQKENERKSGVERRRIGNQVWSHRAPLSMNWSKANTYCSNLNEDDHSDWRLPNIDELRTLILNHSGTETGGSCRISAKEGRLSSKDRLNSECGGRSGSSSKFRDYGWFWSSSDKSNLSNRAWTVDFDNGTVGWDNGDLKSYEFKVRCVRDLQNEKIDSEKQPKS